MGREPALPAGPKWLVNDRFKAVFERRAESRPPRPAGAGAQRTLLLLVIGGRAPCSPAMPNAAAKTEGRRAEIPSRRSWAKVPVRQQRERSAREGPAGRSESGPTSSRASHDPLRR